jgi:NAD(P)-dependent dehydrogenase (short-subunit alcohol dehydrogenase family)
MDKVLVCLDRDVAPHRERRAAAGLDLAHHRLGGLAVRHVVNNAGVVDYAARVDEMTGARLTRMMTTNVVGSFLCLDRDVAPHRERRAAAGLDLAHHRLGGLAVRHVGKATASGPSAASSTTPASSITPPGSTR